MAARVQAKRRVPSTNIKPPPLLEFIPHAYPGFSKPEHLKPLLELLERSKTESVRAVISTPPQHAKSRTILAALIWLLLQDSTKRHGYVSYAQQFARDQSYIARTAAQQTGLELSAESLDRWRTPAGGGLMFSGVGGPLTGSAIDGLLVVDDAVKNRQEAESALYRERTWEWFTSAALTRVHPGGSVICVATRWHQEDLSGRLIKQGWENVNLPAINSNGDALWPEQRPLEWLEGQRAQIGEYDFAALYQGEPRPRGGAVFRDAFYYDELPTTGYREAWGVDWAYTASSRADYSVALQGRVYGDMLYLTDMVRQQSEVPAFLAALKAKGVKKVSSYMSGTEKAIEQFLGREGLHVNRLNATGDKFTRAQPSAAAWNTGRILLPRNAPWVQPLLSELLGFSGVGDAHDDIVDALASLFADLLLEPEKKTTDPALARRIGGYYL